MDELYKSSNKALKTGVASACLQVTSLLWIRTVNNYQYRYGTNLKDTFKILYKDGGILRFYKGYIPSLFVASTCKFADLNSYYYTKNNNFNDIDKLLIISSVSSITRLGVIPIDTLDVFLQVEGNKGINTLYNKTKDHGIKVLYYGASPWILNNFVGTFSWFGVHNYLNDKYKNKFNNHFNIKHGIIGLSSSIVTDIITNPLRILKIYKQSNEKNIGYKTTINNIITERGISELLFRGLKTRLIIHGIQSVFFTVIWKNLEKSFKIN
tara:strand:- start:178 stop:978 length:801 start_codon:yes stop_codon:yes gene_type:complete